MPQFHPKSPPHFLAESNRDAERQVWRVLQQLDESWHVFYSARENSKRGFDREIDFVLIWYNRIFYLEVKGGIVIVDQRAGAGVTWAHYRRSGEAADKRVDPKQLWMAKAALGKTIRQITGKSPRHVGFLEHDFFIFPHTSRASAPEQDLERTNVHYAFAEDIDRLPQRLVQIVRSEKGIFIEPNRIERVIQSFDAMVIKGGGTPPQRPQMGISVVPAGRRLRPELFPSRPHSISRPPSKAEAGMRNLLRFCAGAALLIGLSAILWEDAAKFIRKDASAPKAETRAQPAVRQAPPIPASKPVPERNEAALPLFISRSAASEVEQAIALAQNLNLALNQDEAVPLLWQSGTQHGFVTLQADEGNGCRRYRISRNDLQPAMYEFIRRCS